MRKLWVWNIPFVTGMAIVAVLSSPTPVFGRILMGLLLCIAASIVFDMALKAYMIRTIEETTWSIKIEDEEV